MVGNAGEMAQTPDRLRIRIPPRLNGQAAVYPVRV
jgi:hypothetical protein